MNAPTISSAILGATLACSIFCVNAEEQSASVPSPGKPAAAGQHAGEPSFGPPPEAFKACEGKSSGSRSEFASPHGDTVAGVCENDGNGKIVLRPDHPPGSQDVGHRGPPPEAYQACVGKTAGGIAQFVSPKGETIQGTCEAEGERLVLRPYHPPISKDNKLGK